MKQTKLIIIFLLVQFFNPYLFQEDDLKPKDEDAKAKDENTKPKDENTKPKDENTNETENKDNPKDPTINKPSQTTCNLAKYSYYVRIEALTGSDYKSCGGSIITTQTILTTASCCKGIEPETVTILLAYNGEDYEQQKKISMYDIHPYVATLDPQRPEVTIHDACILTLNTPIEVNGKVKPIQIASINTTFELFTEKSFVEIVGELKQNQTGFRCDKSEVKPYEECGFTKRQCDSKFVFCTEANGIYLGSPVIYQCKLVGMISFEGKGVMYHSRVDTIRKWLELKGLVLNSGIKVNNLRKMELIFVLFIKFLIFTN